MTAVLRVVLDQWPGPSPIAVASGSLTTALVETAPAGCAVESIVPRDLDGTPAGVARHTRLRLSSAVLRQSWARGVAGRPRGMIHSPTLLAPYGPHDSVNDGTHLVVTAWDTPGGGGAGSTSLGRSLLRRAERYADAVVVPSHALAARLAESTMLRDRLHVIAAAPPAGFSIPSDLDARVRDLDLPNRYVVVSAAEAGRSLSTVLEVLAESEVVVVALVENLERDGEVRAAAARAGLADDRLVIRRGRDQGDRAAILRRALAVIAASDGLAWPWLLVEAMAVGAAIVAPTSETNREVLADAARLADHDDFADTIRETVTQAVGDESDTHDSALGRLRIAAHDRGRAFSWQSAAESTWRLHAQL